MPEFDIEQIMKMAENAKNELEKAQQSLETIEVEGASGGGLVKIKAPSRVLEPMSGSTAYSTLSSLLSARLPDDAV